MDARVDQGCQAIFEGDFASLVTHIRRESQNASAAASAAVNTAQQHVEQTRHKLETQVQSLADSQARLLSVVEALSSDAERQHNSEIRARSDAFGAVERVMGTVDELQRTVEQDGDVVRGKLRQLEAALSELQRQHSEDATRTRTTCAELQRLQGEGASRQRQCSDELAGASATISATRQEVGELIQVVQRLDQKLAAWRAEVAAEVSDEVRSGLAHREAAADADRARLDTLQRDVMTASTAKIELETRLEGLRMELSAATSQRGDLEARLREGQQQLERRGDELESRLEGLRSEVEGQYMARSSLEARWKEAQQAVSRRIDALQAAAVKDVEGARQDIEEVASHVQRQEQRLDQRLDQRLEQRFVALKAEVTKEMRSADVLRDEAQTSAEALRRELHQHRSDLDVRLERLRVELTTVSATRDSFEYRLREGVEELRKMMDVAVGGIREELGSLERRVAADAEAKQSGVKEEVVSAQRRLGAELRAEIRSAIKQEQTTMSALDEQLWLTDQRLGQRIDELVQQVAARDRVSAAQSMAELAQAARGDRVTITEMAGGTFGARPSTPTMPAAAEPVATAYEPAQPRRGGLEEKQGLTDEEQLERLRSARQRTSSLQAASLAAEALAGNAGMARSGSAGAGGGLLHAAGGERGCARAAAHDFGSAEAPRRAAHAGRPSALSMAHEAASAMAEGHFGGGPASARSTGSASAPPGSARQSALSVAHEAAGAFAEGASRHFAGHGGRAHSRGFAAPQDTEALSASE